MKSNLGRQAVDQVTGFMGTITSEHRYLTGCTQFGVQPFAKDDGTLPEKQFFDETRLLISGDPIKLDGTEENPGCDVREKP